MMRMRANIDNQRGSFIKFDSQQYRTEKSHQTLFVERDIISLMYKKTTTPKLHLQCLQLSYQETQ